MDSTQPAASLPPAVPTPQLDIGYGLPPGATVVSRKAWFVDEAGVRTLVVGRVVIFQYDLSDQTSHRYAAALLARGKHATQEQVGQAFGMDRRSVNRLCQLSDRSGIGGFVRKTRSDKTTGAVCARICGLRDEGKRIAEIAERTGVSVRTVRTILDEKGYDAHDREAVQLRLLGEVEEASAPAEGGAAADRGPGEGGEPEEPQDDRMAALAEGSAEPAAGGGEEGEPAGEGGERTGSDAGGEAESAGAAAGLGSDGGRGWPGDVSEPAPQRGAETEAPVVLKDGEETSGAGVLLALAGSKDLLESARSVYGELRQGMYGLRSVVLGLLIMALLRVKSVESLKGRGPRGLGRLLGQERIFEVKTLRRKLAEIGEMGKAAEWHREIAGRWVKEDEESVATLYIDGHTRVYYGKRAIAKGWCSRRRLCHPGTSDTWVNDAHGKPILRVSQEGHPALSAVLPGILADVRELIGERECTVVFDRGGWSGEGLKKLRAAGFHFITYRKDEGEPLPESAFEEYVQGEGCHAVAYQLAERQAKLSGYGEVREIVRLCASGKQICIVTSRTGDSAGVVAAEIGGRWQQENFFKYMRAEYHLDGLVDYGSEEVADREIPNPERIKLKKEVSALQSAVKKLQGEYAKVALTKPGSHKAKGAARLEEIRTQIRAQEAHLGERRAALNALAKAVPLSQSTREGERKLSVERKLFIDIIKMTAYRAECALVSRASEHLRRNMDEGHAFVRAVLSQPARLHVAGQRVEVVFAPMSAPRYTRALQGLCDEVNGTDPTYPETGYHLHFAVAPPAGAEMGHSPTGPCQEF